MSAAERALARECWAQCREVLESGRYDIVILDELTYPLAYGWLDHEVKHPYRTRGIGAQPGLEL